MLTRFNKILVILLPYSFVIIETTYEYMNSERRNLPFNFFKLKSIYTSPYSLLSSQQVTGQSICRE